MELLKVLLNHDQSPLDKVLDKFVITDLGTRLQVDQQQLLVLVFGLHWQDFVLVATTPHVIHALLGNLHGHDMDKQAHTRYLGAQNPSRKDRHWHLIVVRIVTAPRQPP